MKTLATILLLLSASLLHHTTADAKPRVMNLKGLIIATGGTVAVPVEWDGIWTTVDSVYNCSGAFITTQTGTDTLCAGAHYQEAAPQGYDFTVTCKGTADAINVNVICDGGQDVIPDCRLDFVSDLDAVRTGENFRAVTVTNVTFTGTAMFCDQFPASCFRTVTNAHRTGFAPPSYCATPTRATTWGEVKTIYR